MVNYQGSSLNKLDRLKRQISNRLKLNTTINTRDTKKKYNHAFSIAFSVNTDNEGKSVTEEELLCALVGRIKDISEGKDCEMIEACGLPHDTYLNDENESSKSENPWLASLK
jgi:hypothetical protein